MTMRRGLFGGTFDPPHIGHLMIMDQVAEALDLGAMMMIPCANPPHRDPPYASFRTRLDMCRIALSGYCKPFGTQFMTNDIEGRMAGTSYSWEMIRAIKNEEEPDCKREGVGLDLFLVMGEDEFVSLPSWKEPDRIVEQCNIVCANRPFVSIHRREHLMEHERATFIDVDGAGGISSTMIRRRLAEGRSIKHLVPDGVATIIYTCGLYGAETSADFVKRTMGLDIHGLVDEHLW